MAAIVSLCRGGRLLALLLALLLGPTACAVPAFVPVALTHGGVKVEVSLVQQKLVERYLTLGGSGWKEIAVSDGLTQGPLALQGPGGASLAGEVKSVEGNGSVIKEEFAGQGWVVRRTIQPMEGKHWVRITETLLPDAALTLHSMADVFRARIEPTWSYAPSVGGFDPDGMYKAPLILVQTGNLAFGVVPDVLALDRDALKRSNHAIDLNVPRTTLLTVGFIPAVRAFHTVFKENLDRTWTASAAIRNDYFLYIAGDAAPDEAYRDAVRFHWSQFGRAALPNAASEQAGTDPKYAACHLWDEWRKTVWERESPDSWLTVRMPDGSEGGAVGMVRAGDPARSVYLSAWFNSLRTSYAMALYARRSGNDRLLQLAEQTLNLALKAPGREGAFKCFVVAGEAGKPTFWGAGDGSGESVTGGYLGFDMSWTGYWMLKWREAGLPGSEGVVERCRRLGDFSIARQTAEGMLPTRFDESGAVEPILSRDVPAETGPVARFLFELYKTTHEARYLRAAVKGLEYLDRSIVPERKWFDYETFWSCSPRLAALDDRTRQWPANDLALIHTVAAYLEAYQITHETRYLTRGRALLDYLLLFQQSWTNPVLEHLSGPVMLLGGFTTQNSDGEWSDARQSLAGDAIMDYYRETGDAEYLERGVEALRAQFPISPSENWAHTAYGGKAGISSFHWGTGSGMAGIEMEEKFLRDVVCDVAAGRCVGVNGLNVTSARIGAAAIDLQIGSPFTWSRKAVVVFHHARPEREYRLRINGGPEQEIRGEQLEAGVEFTPH